MPIINININSAPFVPPSSGDRRRFEPVQDWLLMEGYTSTRDYQERARKKGKAKKGKNCSKGQVCGMSCISKARTCLQNLSSKEFMALNKAKRDAKKAGKGGGGAAVNEEASPSTGFSGENNGIKHQAFMSEREAEEYVKGSVWAEQTFFHGTSEDGADSITTGGVRIDANIAAAHGQGFYMAGGEFGLENAEAFASGQVLSMKVLARNPLVTDGKGHSEIVARGIAEGKIDGSYFTPNKKITTDEQTKHSKEVSAYIKSLGYDAIRIVGKEHFIVFDPAQVAVFKKESTDFDIDALIDSL